MSLMVDRKAHFSADKTAKKTLDDVQQTLRITGYPLTVDRSNIPRTNPTDKSITIACLSAGADYLSLLIEASRRCPGEFVLILSSTWLIRNEKERNVTIHSEFSANNDEPAHLYIRKGLTMDSGGNSYIDVFEPPRKITYLFNASLEDMGSVSCPSGCSAEVSNSVLDVVFMRNILADSGITVLDTLAFPFKTSTNYKQGVTNVTILPVKDCLKDKASIKDAIVNFLKSPDIRSGNKVAIKAVRLKSKDENMCLREVHEVELIVETVVELLVNAAQGDVIFMEKVLTPIKIPSTSEQVGAVQNCFQPKKRKNLGVRLQASVCCGPENDPVVTSIICLIGERVAYEINRDVCVQSLDDTLLHWGINGESSQFILDEVKSKSEKIMKVVQNIEASTKPKDATMCRTGFIEIDFVLSTQDGQLTVIPVELGTQHRSFGHQLVHPSSVDTPGDLWKPMIATMLHRSLGFMIQDKVVLVVGAGHNSKPFLWTTAKENGVKIYLVDDNPDHSAANMVEKFFHFDMTDHKLDSEHCKAIIHLVESNGGAAIDGCVSFFDDCVALVAMICEELSLTSSGLKGAITARSKSKTLDVLSSVSPDVPFGHLMNELSSKTYRIDAVDDILPASRSIHMPAVIKPEYSSGSRAATLVTNVEECYKLFAEYRREIKNEFLIPGTCFGTSMLLTDFIEGPEFGIDVVIFDQGLIDGFVHDKGPTCLPNFSKVASCYPTRLSSNNENQLIFAAYLCCIGIGLENGTFNVDMKMTTTGPKLLEINARLGGFDLRDSIRLCYKADPLLYAFAIACGIKPNVIKMKSTCSLISLYLMPSQYGNVMDGEHLKRLNTMKEKGLINFTLFEDTLEHKSYEAPFCGIGVVDEEFHIAKARLESLCKSLGLGTDDVPVSYYFSYFK